MDSYLTTAMRSWWTAMKASTHFGAYMAAHNGHYYEEADGSKHPVCITKSDCPALVMWPGLDAFTIREANNVEYDVPIPLHYELHVEEEAVDVILNVLEMFLRDMEAAFKAGTIGAGTGLYLWTYGAARVAKTYESADPKAENLVFVSWKATGSVTVTFRRVLESE